MNLNQSSLNRDKLLQHSQGKPESTYYQPTEQEVDGLYFEQQLVCGRKSLADYQHQSQVMVGGKLLESETHLNQFLHKNSLQQSKLDFPKSDLVETNSNGNNYKRSTSVCNINGKQREKTHQNLKNYTKSGSIHSFTQKQGHKSKSQGRSTAQKKGASGTNNLEQSSFNDTSKLSRNHIQGHNTTD